MKQKKETGKLYKIGETAEKAGISVPTLRMYENEGILIPIRSKGGTRYYDDEDLSWIMCIRRMISELGLNLAGIRRLLALIPCRDLKKCSQENFEKCVVGEDSTKPCWMILKQSSNTSFDECHDCPSYRYSVNCDNMKGLFEIRLRLLRDSHQEK